MEKYWLKNGGSLINIKISYKIVILPHCLKVQKRGSLGNLKPKGWSFHGCG